MASIFLPLNLLIIFFLISILASFVFSQENKVIKMTQDGFKPSELTIEKGNIVLFENVDNKDRWPASNIHPTHTIYPEFDPKKPIPKSSSWQFKFEKRGVWKYHDHLLPHQKGVIKVQGDDWEIGLLQKLKNFFIKLWQKLTSPLSGIQAADLKQDLKNLPAQDQFALLEKITKTAGVEAAWRKILDSFKKSPISNQAHDLAHFVGGLIYQNKGLQGLVICTPDFAFGCYHGFFEAAFAKSLDELSEMEKGCLKVGKLNSGPWSSCIHGIGHGIASFFGTTDLKAALITCDKLKNGQTYCFDGVFMEFAKSAPKSFYNLGDPLYPCSSLEEKYLFSCGRNQPTVLLSRLNFQFEDVVSNCGNSPSRSFKSACFDALGFLSVAVSNGDPQKITKQCGQIKDLEFKSKCITAAAGELIFQDVPGWQQASLTLCQSLPPTSQNPCFDYIENIKRDYGRK